MIESISAVVICVRIYERLFAYSIEPNWIFELKVATELDEVEVLVEECDQK